MLHARLHEHDEKAAMEDHSRVEVGTLNERPGPAFSFAKASLDRSGVVRDDPLEGQQSEISP